MRFYFFVAFFLLVPGALLLRAQSENTDGVYVPAVEPASDEEAKIYINTAIKIHRSDPQKAKGFLAQAIKQATRTNNLGNQSSAYTLMLSIDQEGGDIDGAVSCVKALKIISAKAPGDIKVQTNYNQALGLYYRKNGNYKAALPFTLAAAKLSEERARRSQSESDKTHSAGQWLNVAIVYESLGDFNKAMTSSLKSLGRFEEVGNSIGISFCYNNISDIYLHLKHHDKALAYAQKSLILKEQLQDRRGICTALQSIATIYMSSGNEARALMNYVAAIKIAEAEDMQLDQSEIFYNMARIYAKQGKEPLAVSYFKKSKAIARSINNDIIAAKADTELSAMYDRSDSLKRMEQNLISNVQTFKDAGSLQDESYHYKRLSDFYATHKQYEKALAYNQKYQTIKDSLSNNELQLKLQNLEEQYHAVKREKEIELLKKDRLLQQAKMKQQQTFQYSAGVILLILLLTTALVINRYRVLQASRRQVEMERMRNQIAADLHDEVGSSLSSIHMLSQVAALQSVHEASHQDILNRMSTNARETMERMGDIVWMIKSNENEGMGLAQRMERYLYEICGSKNISCKLEGVNLFQRLTLSMQQRKTLYLIFKEAINNSVKYSGTGNIDVNIAEEDQQVRLTVKDYGIGFNTTDTIAGNGLDNMKNRAVELQGRLNIYSLIGQGTTICLKFTI